MSSGGGELDLRILPGVGIGKNARGWVLGGQRS